MVIKNKKNHKTVIPVMKIITKQTFQSVIMNIKLYRD